MSATLLLTRATLPAVALIALVPVALGVGRAVVPPVPAACCTRKNAPGRMVPDRLVLDHVVPTEDAYCTDHPVMSTAAVPVLRSSMKSLV